MEDFNFFEKCLKEDTFKVIIKDSIKRKIKRCCLASLAIENRKPSKFGINTTDLFLAGKITNTDAINLIINKYKRKDVKNDSSLLW